VKRSVVLLLVAGAATAMPSLARPGEAAAQGFTVSGYGDFEAMVEKIGSDNKEFYFDNHHINLILLAQMTDNLFAAAEVEYEHAGEEISLEYGYFGYAGPGDVRVMVGKFIVPFGRFNKDLHPTPINKVIGRPHGFKDILPQTYNDVGLWVSGGKALNDNGRFVFDVFALNGLLGEDGGGIRGLRGADREKADFGRDNNKALGGRVGLEFPYAGFDIGASVYRGKYAETESGDGLSLTLLGVDGSYQRDGFVLRGEVVRAKQEATGGTLTKTGGYVQASYMATSVVEPAVRFSARSMPGESSDQSRIAGGLNFHIAAASIIRVDYIVNMEKSGFKKDNNAFAVQWNIFF
jgi:hypothetical protein